MTIKDIARECGVGIATVSRAVNGSGYVRADLKERILSCAGRMGWHASDAATALKTGRTRVAGVIVNSILGYHQTLVENIILGLREEGYHSYVGIAGNLAEEQRRELASFAGSQLEAVILIATHNSLLRDEIKSFLKGRSKVLLVDETGMKGCLLATFDHIMQGRMAMRNLILRGHRRILYAGKLGYAGSLEDKEFMACPLSHRRKLMGAMAAAQEAGIGLRFGQDIVSDRYKDYSALEAAIKSIGHTAMICDGPDMAQKSYETCRRLGVPIPEGLSIISIGGGPYMELFNPPLEHLHLGEERLASMICGAIAGKAKAKMMVQPSLVEGGSVRDISGKKEAKG